MARTAVRGTGLVLSTSLVLAGGIARADAPSKIQAQSTCADVAWTGPAFVELLRIELRANGIDVVVADATATATAGSLTTRPDACAEDARGATVVFARGATHLERHVDLADVTNDTKARVLALAAVEVVRSALTTPSAPTAPIELRVVLDVSDRSALALPPTPSPPPVAAPGILFGIAAEARAFPRGNAGLFGARLSGEIPIGHLFAIELTAGAAAGGAHDPLGDVDTSLVGGSVGLLVSAFVPHLRVHLGPRLEVDWARFVATPNESLTRGFSASSATALLLLGVTGHVELGAGFWALAGIDAGVTLYGFSARADARDVTSLSGPILGLRVGVAWSPR